MSLLASSRLCAFLLPLALWAAPGLTGPGDASPLVIEKAKAVYPEAMFNQHIMGKVELSCLVTETGAITEIRVEAESRPEFIAAAVQALEKSKLTPGRRDGQPAAMRVTVPIWFTIPDDQLAKWESERSAEVLPPGPPVREVPELSEMPELKKEIRPRLAPSKRKEVDNALLRFVVDEEGVPRDVHVLVATSPECGPAAVTAVRQWRFSPGKLDGQVVRVAMEVPISFFPNNPSANGARLRPGVSRDFITSYKGNPIVTFTGAADEEPPKVLKKARLEYPREMENVRWASVIFLECIINPHGIVTHVRALNAENQYFATAAERSFSRWVFAPPRKGGRPVYYRGVMRADFTIER